MNKQLLNQRIDKMQNDMEKLSAMMYAMQVTNIEIFPEDYEKLSMDAALLGEKVACGLRNITYGTTRIKKRDYLVSAAKVQGIEIECHDGMFEITLPCLLPKRNPRRNSDYLFDSVYFALNDYMHKHTLPHFSHCVVCFTHVYDKSLSLRRVRDHDNIELKQILDIICTFVMVDDTGLLCDTYNTTEVGEDDFCRITVMDKNRLCTWIEGRKTVQNEYPTFENFGKIQGDKLK